MFQFSLKLIFFIIIFIFKSQNIFLILEDMYKRIAG